MKSNHSSSKRSFGLHQKGEDPARPVSQKTQSAFDDDLLFVRQVLQGDETSAGDLRTRYNAQLRAMLYKRGATSTEADDLVNDLWSDCFGASGESLLAKYQGRCALNSWLITVVTNRMIDLKRRESLRRRFASTESTPGEAKAKHIGGLGSCPAEAAVISLLRQSIARAFASASNETLLMLELVHVHDITQREIGRMWNWHESKVSRTLDEAREVIRDSVLNEIHQDDPWLVLRWEDFLELARCVPDLLASP